MGLGVASIVGAAVSVFVGIRVLAGAEGVTGTGVVLVQPEKRNTNRKMVHNNLARITSSLKSLVNSGFAVNVARKDTGFNRDEM